MKKYVVFAYDEYYPGGGMTDLVGSFDDLDEAKGVKCSLGDDYDYIEVVDRDTWEVVWAKK
jgi:hypothetical protein